MHCLEVIIERNDYAAGREEAHAVNDGDRDKLARIVLANPLPSAAYVNGFDAGKLEG
jgi:hypothetical protein